MRRLSPSTLTRVRHLSLARPTGASQLGPFLARPLTSSSPLYYPRSGPYYARHASSAASAPDDDYDQSVFEDKFVDPGAEDDASASSSKSGSSSSTPPNDTEPFAQLVTSVLVPEPTGEPIPEELQTLYSQILTSFLPPSQPIVPFRGSEDALRAKFVLPGGWQPVDIPRDLELSTPENVLALVSPFEGGKHYIEEAVRRVASEIDTEILRFDLALGVGLHGPASPLGRAGYSAPVLPTSTNPLLQELPRPLPPSQPVTHLDHGEEDLGDEHDEDGDHRNSAIVVAPFPGRAGLPGSPDMSQSPNLSGASPEWIDFFEHWLDKTASDGNKSRKRIILLESVEAMASTFDEWWPSLVEAVRRRRRGQGWETIKPSKRNPEGRIVLTQPTTIIFSSSPSLLLPHTCPPALSIKDRAHSSASSIHPVLQEIADRIGGTVETKVDNGDSAPLWWGSEEVDSLGRKERESKRLSALLNSSKGPMSLLPAFGSRQKTPQKAQRHPILDLIIGQAGRPGSSTDDGSDSIVSKALPIIPAKRDKARELFERIRARSLVSAGLVGQALETIGGELVNPLAAMKYIKVENVSKARGPAPRFLRISDDSDPAIAKLAEGKPYRISAYSWQNIVQSWSAIRRLAMSAVGRKLTEKETKTEDVLPVQIGWKEVVDASQFQQEADDLLDGRIRQHLSSKATPFVAPSGESQPAAESAVDPEVAKIKKAKDLTPHEKRLLGCIVDPAKISSTTFDEVHLPFKTIDAIRTIISLPLLFPDAFKGGVLKDHATTGALLFGPPGTGKTLLARAVANASGARMMAIQPSDVNDKYFGEGEKLVKAVFSLARRLSPCVVFLDEVDALFGARSARGGGFGNKAHDQLLTEFMQEMDGLSSADANKDKRVVVVGATNRPFDLDDAVLRRLPRRLLVDLPSLEDRKAILNILLRGENIGEDVDIDQLSKDTDGFSGSDLKHLCVSAALAAVKDSVSVPWNKKDGGGANAQTRPPITNEPSSSEAGQSNIIVETTLNPELVSQPTASTTAEAGTGNTVAQLPGPGREPNSEEIPNSAAAEATTDAVAPNKESSSSSEGEQGAKSSAEKSTESPLQPFFVPRTLLKKHFDVALSEIRPSSSEEGSLPELRRWAEQFGEGGTERGRKKGFGKGFGFAEAGDRANRDKGYGKVAQDD